MAGVRKNPLVFKICENCQQTFSPPYHAREKTRFCCHPCYFAQFRISPKEKFFKIGYTILENGCWEFNSRRCSFNYGYVPNGAKKRLLAHRVSFEIHKGPIPDGLLVCHSCDYGPCVNPDHLWLGTDQDNSDDKIAKGRANVPVGEAASNSKLTEPQVLEIRRSLVGATILARQFGVSVSTIGAVRSYQTWTHI